MIKMKNSSIRKRVTLYYSIVLVLITLLVFGVFLMTASRQVNTVSKDTVMKAVQSSFLKCGLRKRGSGNRQRF